jgi:hypothetical protein
MAVNRRLTDFMSNFGYSIVEKEARPDLAFWGQPSEVYDLIDVFTTVDGTWDPSDKVGSIPVWARNSYLRSLSDPYYCGDLGGATHMFILVLDQHGVPAEGTQTIYWSSGLGSLPPRKDDSYVYRSTGHHGWSNCYMEHHGSGYTPPNRGPWCMAPSGVADVLEYVGLPYSWHISTFGVWKARPAGTAEPDKDHEADGKDKEKKETGDQDVAAAVAALHADVRRLAKFLGLDLDAPA